MRKLTLAAFCFFMLCFTKGSAQTLTNPVSKVIFEKDSLFWVAYNNCDVNGMLQYATTDLEFYHDKSGITKSIDSFRVILSKGLCGNENFRLRRVPVKGTVEVYPLYKNGVAYGAIISGDHHFYVQEKGKKEFLDGEAKFSQLWLLQSDSSWKMARILSYHHHEAPFVSTRKTVKVPAAELQKLTGSYQSAKTGNVKVTRDEEGLLLSTSKRQYRLLPESTTVFFLRDKDLVFEFRDNHTMTILQREEVIDKLQRVSQ